MIKINSIVDQLFISEFDRRNIRLDEPLIKAIESVTKYDRINSEIVASSYKKTVWSKITKRIDDERTKGIYPTFEIADRNRFELIWFPYIREDDNTKRKCRS